MDFLRGKNRIRLYLLLLAVLAAGALAAVWSVSGTGAFLTGEGDWQSLAGDYRIGTIDYTVEINDTLLLGQSADKTTVVPYDLAVPMLAGVRMYDSSAGITDDLRMREFNEGATLMRVRIINHSENMVNVTADFVLHSQTSAGVPPIYALPLPVTLNRSTAATLNYRQYVLDILRPEASVSEADALVKLTTAYEGYLTKTSGKLVLEAGLLPGSTATQPADGDFIAMESGRLFCYYKDVFLLVWSEYGSGEYNTPLETVTVSPPPDTHRQGRFDASFTVGQLD